MIKLIATDMDGTLLDDNKQLPKNFESACAAAANSDFIKRYIPQTILNIYCNQ